MQPDNDCRCLADVAEEVQLLDICDRAVWLGHENVDRSCGHVVDHKNKEAKKQVLQPS